MNKTDIFIVGVGRLVQGHPLDYSDKNMTGGTLVTQQGAPRKDFWFRVAYPKTDPSLQEVFAAMTQIAQTGFPGGQHGYSTFSWKYMDGDAPEHAGKEGWAGCWIFKLSSGYPCKCYSSLTSDPQIITDKEFIKTGYYVRIGVSIKANEQLLKPGLYLNPYLFELVGYGEEIQTGPDGVAILRSMAPAVLPPGASNIPMATGPSLTFPGPPAGMPPGQPAGAMPPGQPVAAMPPGQPIAAMPPGQPIAAMPPGQPIAAMPPGQPVAAMPPGYPVAAVPPGYPVAAVPPGPPAAMPPGPPAVMPPGQPVATMPPGHPVAAVPPDYTYLFPNTKPNGDVPF